MLENEWEEDKTDKKIGTKKLRKLEAKAEKSRKAGNQCFEYIPEK